MLGLFRPASLIIYLPLLSSGNAADSHPPVEETDFFSMLALMELHHKIQVRVERVNRQLPSGITYEERELVLLDCFFL